MGASITAMGWLFGYWLKLRQRRLAEQLNKFYSLELPRLMSKEQRDDENYQG